jgi:DNA mismatch endonuclease (patch repair protein)
MAPAMTSVNPRRIKAGSGKPSEDWVKTRYSQGLSRRKSRDTGPELLLRRNLFHRGLRYRTHVRIGHRMTADFVLTGKIAVFVDGCFWHQCPRQHKLGPRSGPNADRWAAKFATTRCRDERQMKLARELGLLPIRVWECEIAADIDVVANMLAKTSVERRAEIDRNNCAIGLPYRVRGGAAVPVRLRDDGERDVQRATPSRSPRR